MEWNAFQFLHRKPSGIDRTGTVVSASQKAFTLAEVLMAKRVSDKASSLRLVRASEPKASTKIINKLCAFTLAEVLITLAIIGVVAALTIPTVVQNYREQQYKTAYKKAFSNLHAAMNMQKADGEFRAPTIDTSPGYAISDDYGEYFKELSKYFKATKTCFNNDADKCFECTNGEAGTDSFNKNNFTGCFKENYAFIDASGVAWYMYRNRERVLVVDTNGFKEPNKLGRDRMELAWRYTKSKGWRVEPVGDVIAKGRWCPSGNCYYKSWLMK